MVKVFSVLLGAMLLICPLTAQAKDVVVDRILVKINDSIITQYDLDQALKPVYEKIKDRTLSAAEQAQVQELRKQALDNLISDNLIQQEIKRFSINVSEENMDKEIERVRNERGLTLEEFEKVVAQDGLNMDEFRERLKKLLEKQELIGHMVNSKVVVTDSEIQEEYDARKDDYSMGKMVELAIILLPSDVSPVEVREQITGGEMTFADAVAKYSVGPGKDSGGSIGELNWVDLAEEWKSSLDGVAQGGVSSPLTIQGHEALLSPVKINEDRMVPLEDVRDNIYKDLMQKKRETVFTDYFEKLKKSAVIIYMDDSLKPDNGVSQ
ncbi:Chaperone SurA precursor [Pseudodesulfovibrio hydrargyri]|uniref:Chaperone SurA n=1 Tax=Pseudodesulfovibrio hydrargyri TaxID=2125990 RepID=A0A1J5N6D5_9BACT|nr:SurA N-terminal domain-containing protein [Pseudodesulfovibrio hydrargyri]OIQ48863.1 Chaperone SurA precursor [Pseudodesulfovibrio hydrargyri]